MTNKYRNYVLIGALALLILVLMLSGCATGMKPSTGNPTATRTSSQNTPQNDLQSVVAFLAKYDLKVQGIATMFNVKVPEAWDVPLGTYPVGLYWGLVNEYSKDAGLDLTPLKGSTVEVILFSLADGLPGEGTSTSFRYPSNVVLLVQGNKVVGAWLAFNIWSIGPSVTKRNLKDITGLAFTQWVEREKYFSGPGKNTDLADLSPTGVLNAFFEAINRGDKMRANTCLSPQELLDSLTRNLRPDRQSLLYNPGFAQNNSLVENIVKTKVVSYGKPSGNQTTVEIPVNLYIQWRDNSFNTPGKIQTRFAVLEKGANGWKLDGLNTGP